MPQTAAMSTPIKPTEIPAGRLHLRPWQGSDADAVLAACQDPALQRWTSVPVPYTRRHAVQYVQDVSPQGWASGTAAHLAVVDATSERLLAAVSLMDVADGAAEVGAWAVADARGSGVVPAAVRALAGWAFGALGLHRLVWAAEAGNAASLRAAVKAGFCYEGRRRGSVVRRDGSRADGWLLGRTAADGPDGCPPPLPDLPVLRAGDLVLRSWRPSDEAAVARLMADDLFVPGKEERIGGRPTDLARWWVTEQAHEWWACGAGLPVCVVEGDRLVGSLLLFRAGRRAGIAEVGGWVAREARGRGVASVALTALLDWAVPALGLARLEWNTTPDNAGSLALAARLGFAREGTAAGALVVDGRRQDAVVLGLRVAASTGAAASQHRGDEARAPGGGRGGAELR